MSTPKIDVRGEGGSGVFSYLPAMPQKRQGWDCFSSPETMVEAIKAFPRSGMWKDKALTERADRFTGGADWKEACRLAEQGWQEGAERVARLRDKIVTSWPVKRRLTSFDVGGQVASIPRAIAGNPKAMVRLARAQDRNRPVITLINSGSGSAFIDANVFTNRAAVVAALVDVIEGGGYSVHVIDVDMSENKYNDYLFGKAVTVKEAGSVPDLARLAFALGHAAMFRIFGFHCRGAQERHRAIDSGYGTPVEFEVGTRPNTFILPSSNKAQAMFSSEDIAATQGVEYFISLLRSQGCPAFRKEVA